MLDDAAILRGVALMALCACSPESREPSAVEVTRTSGVWTVAAHDTTDDCSDVGELRVCWPNQRAAPPSSVVARPIPKLAPASSLGWRCTGAGAERRCRDRSLEVARFSCTGEHCVQPLPRFPDDGEWTCADAAGAVVCTGGDTATGVATGPADDGFVCGARHERAGRPGARVCVDFAPDFPDGSERGWRCRFEHAGTPRKICDRSRDEHVLGDACDASRPCVDGSVCASGRCVPRRPSVGCWLDADCPEHACRFGSCVDAVPAAPQGPSLTPVTATSTTIVLHSPDDPAVDLARVRAHPPQAIRSAATVGTALVLDVVPEAVRDQLEIAVAGACPVQVSRSELARGARIERSLGSRVTIQAPSSPIGPDREFSVELVPRCTDITDVSWSELDGVALRAWAIDRQGLRLSARTPRLDALLPTIPWGIVPVSAAERGAATLEVRWTEGERRVRRRIEVTTLARNRGLPSIASTVPFLLGGGDWTPRELPDHSKPVITRVSAGALSVTLNEPGHYVFADRGDRRLAINASSYSETPLDCGRSDCHAPESVAAIATRMTNVLASGLSGAFGPYQPTCALACHATGEPGLADGGFTDVAGVLGFSFDPNTRTDWATLPRPLRRVGGVGCLACHGPGAIPEADARWAILRTAVCATCHDAPPRYGHVAAWQSTRMSRADADPATRAEPCARCHTTSGALSARAGHRVGNAPPTEIGALGLGCAVCHAVHGDAPVGQPDSSARLLHAPALTRDANLPAALQDLPSTTAASTVCIGCHYPDGDAPWASAAALWAGRGGLDPETDRPLDGKAPHRDLPGGCIACHAGGPTGLERGASHGFTADRAQCALCHESLPPPSDLVGRARALLMRLVDRGVVPKNTGNTPPHARSSPPKISAALGRAAYDVLLVLEDPAAADHNPSYASALLDAAEHALERR